MDVASCTQAALQAHRHGGELALDALEVQVQAAACRHDLACSQAFARAAAKALQVRVARLDLQPQGACPTTGSRQGK